MKKNNNKAPLQLKNVNKKPIYVNRKHSIKKRKRNIRFLILLIIISVELIILAKVLFKKDNLEVANKNIEEVPVTIIKEEEQSLSKFTVFIDPGHGFSDDGAVSPKNIGSINESKTVLDIALKLKGFLIEKGVNVVLSRETNYDKRQEDKMFKLQNSERVQNAESIGADVYISIHIDSLDESIKGFDEVNGYNIYYCDNETKKTDNVKLFAQCIMDGFLKATNVNKMKLKSMGSDNAFYVVNHTTMPSALFEMGYCTNREDVARLADENWRIKAARGIANGIIEYFDKISTS